MTNKSELPTVVSFIFAEERKDSRCPAGAGIERSQRPCWPGSALVFLAGSSAAAGSGSIRPRSDRSRSAFRFGLHPPELGCPRFRRVLPGRPGRPRCRRAGQAPLRPKKRPGRAWIELGAFLAYSTTSYWTSAAFPEDWQFQLNWHDQFDRVFLLKGWRFDSNNFKLNWTHSLAGGVYYQFARSNNLSWIDSWLMAVAASTYWETVVEWKEVISVNDQITTALGAFSTGEPWYQIGHYLAHQRGILSQALSFINPAVRLNHWLDRKKPGAKRLCPAGMARLRPVPGRQAPRPGRAAGRDGSPFRSSYPASHAAGIRTTRRSPASPQGHVLQRHQPGLYDAQRTRRRDELFHGRGDLGDISGRRSTASPAGTA